MTDPREWLVFPGDPAHDGCERCDSDDATLIVIEGHERLCRKCIGKALAEEHRLYGIIEDAIELLRKHNDEPREEDANKEN